MPGSGSWLVDPLVTYNVMSGEVRTLWFSRFSNGSNHAITIGISFHAGRCLPKGFAVTSKCDFENPEVINKSLSATDLQKILSLQSLILEKAVVSDNYDQLLDELCRHAESFTPNAVAAIMAVDPATQTLNVINGPSLSSEAIEAFDGLRSGDGSCGNAVLHGQEMYVCDTLEDLRWVNLRGIAEEFNICSCFSFPIVDRDNCSIGSFSISSFEKRQPEGFHKALLETCTSICGVIFQRRADDEMRQHIFDEKLRARKLASLGLLAGGIAHDFNNLLGAILGNVDLAASTLKEGAARESLEWAMKAIDRASGLTQQLLAFSRGGTPIRKPNDIGDIIRDSLEFSLHDSNVGFLTSGLDRKGGCILNVDAGQIGQLIQNLAMNARQSLGGGGGKITVSCQNVGVADHPSLDTGDYFRIDFVDDGPGIPSDMQQKIFDPYFTTRDHGTGLGLALCYSIVTNHNGYISVRSTPPNGTEFTIYLPFQDGLELEPEPPVQELRKLNGGRVIVMDDEEMTRKAVGRMMETLGFDILPAKDGDEVLLLLENAEKEENLIDLIIVDLTVPGGMGGIETKDRILLMNPDAKVIVSSGYSENPVMSDFAKHGFCGAVAKPYRLVDLKTVLAKALG